MLKFPVVESTCAKYANVCAVYNYKCDKTQLNSTLINIVSNQPHCNIQINLPPLGNVIRNANFVNPAQFLKVMYAFTEKETLKRCSKWQIKARAVLNQEYLRAITRRRALWQS